MARSRGNPVPIVLAVVYSALGVAAAVMFVYGLNVGSTAWQVAAVAAVLVIGATAPVAALLAGLASRLGQAEQIRRALAEVREHTMLSDNAKRVLFRDREVQMLRDAIADDIARGDYNTAIALCDEMANVFGYRQEAESFRSQIAEVRARQEELEVQAALDQLDASLAEHHWAAVHLQAARIRRLYPESHVVHDLERRIQNAREQHKRELESRFLEAADAENVQGAMDLLRELDRYLTRDEAARISRVAEGVIVRHRDQLGEGFRRAVSERRWAEAVRIGTTIMEDYPNSGMAAEARSMIEVLRGRAERSAAGAPEPEKA